MIFTTNVDTPAGESVNETGCSSSQTDQGGNTNGDQDNDGVIDILDECPDTEAGAAVDYKGCSQAQGGQTNPTGDDDNDGVINALDECPETEAGASVDYLGCSEAQGGQGNPDILLTPIMMVWSMHSMNAPILKLARV